MNKKKIIGTLLASSIALTTAFTGCSLVTENNTADMLQVIATVNISKAEGLDTTDKALIDTYKDAIGTTEIYKNELIAYYLNYGISYVNMGYPASTVFNMLVDSLVENAVLTQYASMYLLNEKVGTADASSVISDYSKMTYIEQLEYLLTDENEEDPDKEIKIAKYSFYSMLNSTLDSYESRLLDDEDSTSGSASRAIPSGVDTEQEGFYPAKDGELDYSVYTGYKGYLLEESGDYQKDALEGTTRATRTKAYDDFLTTLIKNGLVDPDKDNLLDITGGIEYMEHEYAAQLGNRVINKYYEVYEAKQEDTLTNGGAYDYLDKTYNKMLAQQQKNVDDTFTSDIGSLSDSSFVLYAPDTEDEGTYGFVYNILLPFNAKQSASLSALQSNSENRDNATGAYTFNYYKERNQLLKQILTTDQREAWFNGATDYSFNAADAGLTAGEDYFAGENNRQYLFFENNLTKTDRYESLNKYLGQYAYNGKVYELEDGGYQLIPEKLSIDGMLAEFKAYIDFVLGDGSVEFTEEYGFEKYDGKLTEESFFTAETAGEDVKAKDKKIDYSNFIYASGKVNLGDVDINSPEYRSNIFYKESAQYKALAAVNELQYAYTTDTGVLAQYLGYSVTLGDTTGYIKEFETAAQEAISNGPGSFSVCAGDYGWHLIYVTYTYDPNGGAVYEPNWQENVDKEGTFENFFYEWVKSNKLSQVSSLRRTHIMTQFNKDTTVNKIQSAYQNLLDLDS